MYDLWSACVPWYNVWSVYMYVLRRKYIDRKVSRTFDINGQTVQYRGVFDRVFWDHELRKFLFHVSYSDGDEEELELWQVRIFVV